MTEVFVPQWFAEALYRRFGTIEAAQQWYGMRITVIGGLDSESPRKLGNQIDQLTTGVDDEGR